jgi:hypothetical protein
MSIGEQKKKKKAGIKVKPSLAARPSKTPLEASQGDQEVIRGRGRPRGDRRRGSVFVQAFFWLRETTKTRVERQLKHKRENGHAGPQHMGVLIESLLQEWLDSPEMQSDRKFGGTVKSKSTDAHFTPCGILIDKTVKRSAMRTLEDNESPMDLSDLVQALLVKWLATHSSSLSQNIKNGTT